MPVASEDYRDILSSEAFDKHYYIINYIRRKGTEKLLHIDDEKSAIFYFRLCPSCVVRGDLTR
jgi:hypothetical protein